MIYYHDAGVRELLRGACKRAGTQKQFAIQHKLSASYINDVLKGKRMAGPSILKALKLKKHHHYEEHP